MSDLLDAFVADYPDYLSTHAVDSLRAREYRRLDDQQHAYLDYTGASLHAESQVLEHAALLNEHIFGNPHSASPSSHNMTKLVEQTRRAVLDWFNAPPDEYVAIFTANATGALKHVGESYPFSQGAGLLLTVDNHNSVNGIREFARAKGAPVDYAPLTVPELRIDRGSLDAMLAASGRAVYRAGTVSVSCAIELHRRQTSAGPHRVGARARVGRAARRRLIRANQSA